MAVQNLIDRYSSTLSGSYTSGGGSISVTSATGLPSGACNFYAIVKAEGANTEEVFLVTNVSGTTLTVTGAQLSTSASNHANGATIIAGIYCSPVVKATGYVLVAEVAASGSSTEIDVTTGITSDYDTYMIELLQLTVQTNSATIELQVSTNGGSSYDTTSGHYAWQAFAMVPGASGANGSQSDTNITLIVQMASTTNNNFCAMYHFYNPGGGSTWPSVTGTGTGWDTSGNRLISYTVGGFYLQTTAVNAFRIKTSSGNILAGTVRLFGLAK